MTFLASITTGAVLLVSASAAEWQSEVASEITIQVRPVGRARSRTRRGGGGRGDARASPASSRSGPSPRTNPPNCWSPGSAAGCRSTICRCRASSSRGSSRAATLDLAALRSRVTQAAPTASVDDHRAWIERMRSMTGATVFAGVGILALVIIATIISVSFATRGAMAANRPIVEVLHFVGAGDRYIANRFQRHFLRLGLEGGLIGGGVAMLVFGFSESIAGWFSGTPVGDQFAALAGHVFAAPVGLSGAGGAGGADRGDHRLGLAANAVCHARRHRLKRCGVRYRASADSISPENVLDLWRKDCQHRMSQPPDDRSLADAPDRTAPRRWLRAAIVAVLALAVRRRRDRLCRLSLAVARRRSQAGPQRRRHRGADRRLVAGLRRDGIAGRRLWQAAVDLGRASDQRRQRHFALAARQPVAAELLRRSRPLRRQHPQQCRGDAALGA